MKKEISNSTIERRDIPMKSPFLNHKFQLEIEDFEDEILLEVLNKI